MIKLGWKFATLPDKVVKTRELYWIIGDSMSDKVFQCQNVANFGLLGQNSQLSFYGTNGVLWNGILYFSKIFLMSNINNHDVNTWMWRLTQYVGFILRSLMPCNWFHISHIRFFELFLSKVVFPIDLIIRR